jgi:hypothetical protein
MSMVLQIVTTIIIGLVITFLSTIFWFIFIPLSVIILPYGIFMIYKNWKLDYKFKIARIISWIIALICGIIFGFNAGLSV